MLLRAALNRLLDGAQHPILRPYPQNMDSSYERLAIYLAPHFYRRLVAGREGTTKPALQARSDLSGKPSADATTGSTSELSLIEGLVDHIEAQLETEGSVWGSSLAPWAAIIRSGEESFGRKWAFLKLAVLAAGIKSNDEVGTWTEREWNATDDLCSHIRFARLKSGNQNWWSEQLDRYLDLPCRSLVALTFAIWATPRTIVSLATKASRLLDALDESEWQKFFRAFVEINWVVDRVRQTAQMADPVPDPSASPRLAIILGRRGKPAYARLIYSERLQSYKGADQDIVRFCYEMAVQYAGEESDKWQKVLEWVRLRYGVV
jgi:hypothetical protein